MIYKIPSTEELNKVLPTILDNIKNTLDVLHYSRIDEYGYNTLQELIGRVSILYRLDFIDGLQYDYLMDEIVYLERRYRIDEGK